MQAFTRLLPVAIAMLVFFDGQGTPVARADGCPGCMSNSPIINPFPIMWLRWGTGRVLSDSSTCPIRDIDHAYIAIDRIEPKELNAKGNALGYQLIIIDDNNQPICKGTELIGITFELSANKEPVIVQQIAKTKIETDSSETTEYRLLYYISSIKTPDNSLCSEGLRDANWLRRAWWRARDYKGPEFSRPQASSKLEELFEVFPDHLAEYAVIIPDAAYDSEGVPQDPSTFYKKGMLEDIGQAGQVSPGKVSLEWFEFSCASGALAHTDLSGLVEIGEPKKIRTAALRMFRAQYRDYKSETLDGTPISYIRNASRPCKDPQNCAAELQSSINDNVEAMWSDEGATCLSHSRRWLKNTVISKTLFYKRSLSLPESETRFMTELKFNGKLCNRKSTGYFTSYVMNHIDHKMPSPNTLPPTNIKGR